jgi:hypothetical protein
VTILADAIWIVAVNGTGIAAAVLIVAGGGFALTVETKLIGFAIVIPTTLSRRTTTDKGSTADKGEHDKTAEYPGQTTHTHT